MRLCRFRQNGSPEVAIYDEQWLVPLRAVARAYAEAQRQSVVLPLGDSLLAFLPPDGDGLAVARRLDAWLREDAARPAQCGALAHQDVELLVPIPRPPKLFLLAGNYAKHIEEGGGQARERAETFPYVFMKPPSTTLTAPGGTVHIPAVSPAHVDWELELAVVIGRRAKGVREAEALQYVAGYTVINDISDRKFRPNPGRVERPRDAFFDWLHGKWHDSFCPCGPCVVAADALPDPQALRMTLQVNGNTHQDASTAQQIFPVAAVIEFISSFVTLEPGDLISTGTPHGVGNTSGTYLKAGDRVEATIESIGTLISLVASTEDPQ